MGVPKLFRWLMERYPLTSQPLPTEGSFQVDNLYLDMNNIVHPCFHPDDENGVVRSEPVIFMSIFNAIDHLLDLVMPEQLLYLAVDGVAPKAKVNQQRARRFQSAASRESTGNPFDLPDSNCITPGTEFMERLAKHLQYYVCRQVSENPKWRKLKVIVSGPDVPGEGEHKIMAYMRWARTLPEYDPNTRHCLYGADADLMLLGLFSHEPHITVLREVFRGRQDSSNRSAVMLRKDYSVVHLNILRNYLTLEFEPVMVIDKGASDSDNSGGVGGMDVDPVRIVDDLVSLSSLVGNDFLPNFPSLYIPNNSIDAIWKAYAAAVREVRGGEYIINVDGSVNWLHMRRVLLNLAVNEENFFRGTESRDDAFAGQRGRSSSSGGGKGGKRGRSAPSRDKRQFAEAKLLQQQESSSASAARVSKPLSRSQSILWVLLRNFSYSSAPSMHLPPSLVATRTDHEWVTELAQKLGCEITEIRDRGVGSSQPTIVLQKDTDSDSSFGALGVFEIFEEYTPASDIKENWMMQYYLQKFTDLDGSDDTVTEQIGCDWLKGFQWVLKYYRESVPSWSWSYNHHYAPLLKDAARACLTLAKIGVNFADAHEPPLLPFEQLLSVLPAYSSPLIPEALRPLMLDESSSVIHYYPRQFATDQNGKINSYESVVIIPFVDTAVLRNAMKPFMSSLRPEELARNTQGHGYVVTHDASVAVSSIPGIVDDIDSVSGYSVNIKVLERELEAETPIYGIFADALLGSRTPDQMGSLLSVHGCSGRLMHLGVNSFGRPSVNTSMALTIPPSSFDNPNDPDVGRKAAVYYFERLHGYARGLWPCLEHVRIVALSTVHGVYFTTSKPPTSERTKVVSSYYDVDADKTRAEVLVVFQEHTAKSLDEWKASVVNLEKKMTKRHGVFISKETVVLAHIKRLSAVPDIVDAKLPEEEDDDDLLPAKDKLPSLSTNMDAFDEDEEERTVSEDNSVVGIPVKLSVEKGMDSDLPSLEQTVAQPLSLIFPATKAIDHIKWIESDSVQRAAAIYSLSASSSNKYKKLVSVDARSHWSQKWLAARVVASSIELTDAEKLPVLSYTVVFNDGQWVEYHVHENQIRPGTMFDYASTTIFTKDEENLASKLEQTSITTATIDEPSSVNSKRLSNNLGSKLESLPPVVPIQEQSLPSASAQAWTLSEYTGILVDPYSEARTLSVNEQNMYDCPFFCGQGPFHAPVQLKNHLNKSHEDQKYPSPGYRPSPPPPVQQPPSQAQLQLPQPQPKPAPIVHVHPDSAPTLKATTRVSSGHAHPSSSQRQSQRPNASTAQIIPKSYIAEGARAIRLLTRRPPNETFIICPFDTTHLVPFSSMVKHMSQGHFTESKTWKLNSEKRVLHQLSATDKEMNDAANQPADDYSWAKSDEFEAFVESRYKKSSKKPSAPAAAPTVPASVARNQQKGGIGAFENAEVDAWISSNESLSFSQSLRTIEEPVQPTQVKQSIPTPPLNGTMKPQEDLWSSMPSQAPTSLMGQSVVRPSSAGRGRGGATIDVLPVAVGRGRGRGSSIVYAEQPVVPQYQPMPVSYPPQMYSPTPPQQQYAPIPQTPVWSPDVWSPEPYKPGPAQSYQLYPHQQQPQAIYTHAYMPAAAAMHHPHMPYAAVTTTSPQLGYVTRTVSQWLQQIGLAQYTQAFMYQGFDDMRLLADMSDAEMERLFGVLGVLEGHKMQFRRCFSDLRRG